MPVQYVHGQAHPQRRRRVIARANARRAARGVGPGSSSYLDGPARLRQATSRRCWHECAGLLRGADENAHRAHLERKYR
jgi:hypothetical protein